MPSGVSEAACCEFSPQGVTRLFGNVFCQLLCSVRTVAAYFYARKEDRLISVWLIWDGLVHLSLVGNFVAMIILLSLQQTRFQRFLLPAVVLLFCLLALFLVCSCFAFLPKPEMGIGHHQEGAYLFFEFSGTTKTSPHFLAQICE